jgi:hypothetical protein
MNIFNWFADLFTDSTPSSVATPDVSVNPASGLPMVGGIGGVDVDGNPYGTDISNDHFVSSSSDDSFSSGSSFDDNLNSSSDIFSDW